MHFHENFVAKKTTTTKKIQTKKKPNKSNKYKKKSHFKTTNGYTSNEMQVNNSYFEIIFKSLYMPTISISDSVTSQVEVTNFKGKEMITVRNVDK